jgi:LysR family hydrogen peroxide-inducible transcriptional activator
MGISFLPALYVRSEIRGKLELRIADVEGINVVRNHALVWRNTSPARNFYRELAEVIRAIIEKDLGDTVLPASHSKMSQRAQ